LLDEILSLSAFSLRSVVVMALGYRSTEDFNADLPKARLSKEVVIRFFISHCQSDFVFSKSINLIIFIV
jgi:hypothetical protein